ncbi:hypothetical protein EVAR_75305_1 [Eumeta japonica]|uniref:Uncharacterized protein n=1 Tax=Eumeta variegata TaxID=151549 RepID=A0A4C1YYB6_EUMVA|nr:hypothetical protein EVAR_75305_1 [Eumeta japonica]
MLVKQERCERSYPVKIYSLCLPFWEIGVLNTPPEVITPPTVVLYHIKGSELPTQAPARARAAKCQRDICYWGVATFETDRLMWSLRSGSNTLLSSRVGCVLPLSFFYSDASADGVEERSLVRSPQAERDNESCFFVRAAGVHRFKRRISSPEKCHGKITFSTGKVSIDRKYILRRLRDKRHRRAGRPRARPHPRLQPVANYDVTSWRPERGVR